MPKPILTRSIFSALAAVFGAAFMIRQIAQHKFEAVQSDKFVLRINDIGTQMLDTQEHGYLLPLS